jgi:hypothetical protein
MLHRGANTPRLPNRDLLVNGIGMAAAQIFCSSVEGHTIPTGARIKEFSVMN